MWPLSRCAELVQLIRPLMKPSAVGSTLGVAHYTRASKSASVAELSAHPRDQWFSKLGSIMAKFLGVPAHVLISGIDGQVSGRE